MVFEATIEHEIVLVVVCSLLCTVASVRGKIGSVKIRIGELLFPGSDLVHEVGGRDAKIVPVLVSLDRKISKGLTGKVVRRCVWTID